MRFYFLHGGLLESLQRAEPSVFEAWRVIEPDSGKVGAEVSPEKTAAGHLGL